jgi:hypothetical protein
MDFDQAVVGIASQPFWLFWVADGKVRSHRTTSPAGSTDQR